MPLSGGTFGFSALDAMGVGDLVAVAFGLSEAALVFGP